MVVYNFNANNCRGEVGRYLSSEPALELYKESRQQLL